MANNILRHLALIMDGNGRWAKRRGLIRTRGHERGAEVIRDITKYCAEHDTIETLTLYAFSTENWKRPKYEVDFLMRLLDRWLEKELPTYHKFGAKFETIGNIEVFSPKLQRRIAMVKEETKHYTNVTQIMALNYGSREEIVRAVSRLNRKGEEVTEESLSRELDSPYSDIDLLIRTSGEQRISNFLMWQISYAELFFTDTLWPDFTPRELEQIIAQFIDRDRRFGGV
ncbi:MAG: di-trans,poly-cis-decaprenylcistransferase [Epsilonproteobacteria bacterium]|jgi:undecaprenyl diphosphate synthase|nr:di-trans,poly-cis-decaprenylcistransferase [Campylobacterota bacterium]